MRGSEKQIKWAEDIKATFEKDVVKATKEQILAVSEYPADISFEDYHIAAQRIMEKDSAYWWINNIRGEDLEMFTMRFENFDEDAQEDLDDMIGK